MNKLKNILIGLVATISLTSVAYAGSFGLGVTGSYTNINGSGTETTEGTETGDSSTRTKSVDNNATLPSIYAEYSFDDASWGSAGNGITIGASYTPGSADVSDKVFSRTDTAEGQGGNGDSSGSVTYKAQGTYGNKTLDGTNLGVGLKGVTSSNIVWKLAYEETDFDTLNLTSTTTNKIKADLDTEAVSLSIGYRF